MTSTTTRTDAVIAALDCVKRTGKNANRNADGTPSKVAYIVGYALNRGAEAVQQEIDAFVEETY